MILASASPRRRDLLERLGIPFEVIEAAGTDESAVRGSAREIVEILAVRKAERVSAGILAGTRHGWIETQGAPDGRGDAPWAVLAADTVVAVGEEQREKVLGKPRGVDDARRMLCLLSGRSHSVWTGVAVLRPDRPPRIASEMSRVTFRPLSEQTIEWYLGRREFEGKAGAYAIQGEGRSLVAGFTGCYYNIVGLPLVLAARLLGGLVPVTGCDCAHHPLQLGEPGCGH